MTAKNLVKRVSARFPHRIPQSSQALSDFIDHWLDVFALDKERRDYRRRVAETLMHAPQEQDTVRPIILVRAVRRGIGNQHAWNLIAAVKEQDRAEEEAKKKAAQEAQTAASQAPEASGGQPAPSPQA